MSSLEVRCTCSERSLLAMAGVDGTGLPFVHVKAWSRGRLTFDVIATAGIAKLRCRACDRYTTIDMTKAKIPPGNDCAG